MPGSISRRISMRLGTSSIMNSAMPVKLPPGRA